jgi:hypothetical protein
MARRFSLFAVWFALLCYFYANPSFSLETVGGPDGVVREGSILERFITMAAIFPGFAPPKARGRPNGVARDLELR